jgi:hypothetical protein
MQVEVEHHWLPTMTREYDLLLMDLFMSLNFSHTQMENLTSCRLFLQVVALSDITSAEGKYILPSYLNGCTSRDRNSSLK